MMSIIRNFFVLLCIGFLFSACSSQDFGQYGGQLMDIVDSGKPYVENDAEEQAALRAQRFAEVLTRWEEEERGPETDYLVGADDILEIGVLSLDVPNEVSVLQREIRKNGKISLPLIGDIEVAGCTLKQLEVKITGAYRGKYLKDPDVSLKVAEYRSAPVVVTGAVTKPGVYYMRHNESSVLEILAEADGLTAEAGAALIIVRNRPLQPAGSDESGGGAGDAQKEGGEAKPVGALLERPIEVSDPMIIDAGLEPVAMPEDNFEPEPEEEEDEELASEMITVDLEQLLARGDVRLNVRVLGGDIVSIPAAKQEFIYVLGYVRNPGSIELDNSGNMRALHAVSKAGGLSASARAQNSFLVTEKNGKRKVIKIDLTKIARGVRPPLYMYSGDTLVVGSSLLAKLGEFVKPSVGASASYSPVP